MLKIQKKHLKSLIVMISATVLVVVGSVMAFFTSADEVTNRFSGRNFDITLTETNWDASTAKDVIPGMELDKNPQVINKERTEGYIFLRVTVPCDSQMVDNDDGTPRGASGNQVPMYKFMVAQGTDPETYAADNTFSPKQTVNSHWRLVPVENANYSYYDSEKEQYIYVYAFADGNTLTPLIRNGITPPLFDKLQLWNFNEEYDPDKSHSVLVEAFGIQTDLPGYTASDIAGIWSLLKEEVEG